MKPRCLVDGTNLVPLEAGLLSCPTCRGMYALDIYAETDPAIIDRIIREGLACTECEQILPGQARVWAGKDGEPAECPTHGLHARKRLRWFRWRRRARVPS